jgi:hypothetical protein
MIFFMIFSSFRAGQYIVSFYPRLAPGVINILLFQSC